MFRALANRKLSVYSSDGKKDPASYIAAGDLCTVIQAVQIGVSTFYEVQYPTSKGPKVRYLKTLSGFLVNQNNYKSVKYPAPGYEKATIASGGCGVCSMVNALGSLLGKAISVPSMAQFSISNGARVPGGTNMLTLCKAASKKWGITYSTTNSGTALKNHLANGGVAICNVAGNGIFSNTGHYIVCAGTIGSQLAFLDCGLYNGKYGFMYPRRKMAVKVSGDVIFSSYQTLNDDCYGRTPCYYLIGRG